MAATAVPHRSIEQQMQALAEANAIRTYRARLKGDIKLGRVSALGILAVPPEQTQTMKVIDVLLAMPSVGRVRANTMLRRAGVSPSKTLSGLSERQRAQLLALLPGAKCHT
jgi:hypothetical protein